MKKQKVFFPTLPVLFMSMLFVFSEQEADAQSGSVTWGGIYGTDTVPLIYLRPVNIEAAGGAIIQAKRISYYKMKRDVRAALPYAKLAATKLREINDKSLLLKNERQRKKYIKDEEKKMKEKFEDDLKNLTVTQGRVLIKLIDRETGETTYALIKELKGSLNAYLYQGLAHLWGSDLKSQYDAKGEDAMMEQIVGEIEKEGVEKK